MVCSPPRYAVPLRWYLFHPDMQKDCKCFISLFTREELACNNWSSALSMLILTFLPFSQVRVNPGIYKLCTNLETRISLNTTSLCAGKVQTKHGTQGIRLLFLECFESACLNRRPELSSRRFPHNCGLITIPATIFVLVIAALLLKDALESFHSFLCCFKFYNELLD